MEYLTNLGFGATLTIGSLLGIVLKTIYSFLDRTYLQRRGSGLLMIEPKTHGKALFYAKAGIGKDIVSVLHKLGEAYTEQRVAFEASKAISGWATKGRLEETARLLERYADGEPDKLSTSKTYFVETFSATGELLLMNCGNTPIFVYLDTPQVEGAEVGKAEGMPLIADAINIEATESIALKPGEMRTFAVKAELRVERKFASEVSVYRKQVAYLEDVQKLNKLYDGLCDDVRTPVSVKLPIRFSFVTAGIRLWHDKPVSLNAKRNIDVMVCLNSVKFDESTANILEMLTREAVASEKAWAAQEDQILKEGRDAWMAGVSGRKVATNKRSA